MTKGRVLLVCYYFPPMGGAGVLRPLALYRHLPESGYECHVLTVKPVAYRVFEPELLEGLRADGIYRAGSFDPQRLMRLMGVRTVSDSAIRKGRGLGGRLFPDAKVGWVRRAVKFGRVLLSNRDYDAIISTSPPISAHLAARRLAREFRRPWVADFRDYWAGTVLRPEDAFADRPERLGRIEQLLRGIQSEAAAVTAVNASVGEYAGASHTIYNCYDSVSAQQWREPSASGVFRIGVLGTLNEHTPVRPLLEVLDRLRREDPKLFGRTEVVQVGETDPEWLGAQLDDYNLRDKFVRHGWKGRAETVGILSETSLLYVGVESAREGGLSTGRIYTMLASGRPIIAFAPVGSELRRLVESCGCGLALDRDAIDHGVAYVRHLAEQAERGELRLEPCPGYARPFSSEVMAERFAAVLDTLPREAYR